MSLHKSCHRCAQPYDSCLCHMFNPDGTEVKEKKSLDSHYKTNKIEPFDVIADMGDLESFCRGNAIKYLIRYKHKGTPVQDLEKAKVYIDKLIELEK